MIGPSDAAPAASPEYAASRAFVNRMILDILERQEAKAAAKERIAGDEAFWSAAQQALQERERRQKVAAFLSEHNFSGVNARRGWLWSYTYPLHCAAKHCDVKMVRLLLESKAERRQKDSEGRTAKGVAKVHNQNGSHAEVIKALRSQRPARPQGLQRKLNGKAAGQVQGVAHASALYSLGSAMVAETQRNAAAAEAAVAKPNKDSAAFGEGKILAGRSAAELYRPSISINAMAMASARDAHVQSSP